MTSLTPVHALVALVAFALVRRCAGTLVALVAVGAAASVWYVQQAPSVPLSPTRPSRTPTIGRTSEAPVVTDVVAGRDRAHSGRRSVYTTTALERAFTTFPDARVPWTRLARRSRHEGPVGLGQRSTFQLATDHFIAYAQAVRRARREERRGLREKRRAQREGGAGGARAEEAEEESAGLGTLGWTTQWDTPRRRRRLPGPVARWGQLPRRHTWEDARMKKEGLMEALVACRSRVGALRSEAYVLGRVSIPSH